MHAHHSYKYVMFLMTLLVKGIINTFSLPLMLNQLRMYSKYVRHCNVDIDVIIQGPYRNVETMNNCEDFKYYTSEQ